MLRRGKPCRPRLECDTGGAPNPMGKMPMLPHTMGETPILLEPMGKMPMLLEPMGETPMLLETGRDTRAMPSGRRARLGSYYSETSEKHGLGERRFRAQERDGRGEVR